MAAYSCISYCCLATLEREGRMEERGAMVVHVGSIPLRGPAGPLQWAYSSADRLFSVQHFYTILQPISADRSSPCTVFDFQPQNPEDLKTAFVGLSGGAVPGVVYERTISCLPSRRCWRVGVTKDGISMKDAVEFNRDWDTNLQVSKHDCRHHTNAFVEFLTGEKEILQKLRNAARVH